MNKVANNQTFEELFKAIKEVTLMSGVAREKKKVVEETTFHESNKLDLGLGSGAYGEDANYHEFMDDSVMEEIYIVSPVMLVAEDLGQKRIHDSSKTAMVLGSQGKSNEIGYFNGPIVQNISDNREKSEKIVTDEHIRDAGVSFFGCSDDDTEAIVVLRKACFVYESFGKMMKLDSFRVLDFEKCRV
ncbi:hypothetical protein Tco_1441457 [Tanacetum coccineum]